MAYLNLDGDKFFSYPRDFNGKMSLVLTAMLAKDYLKKYANICERYTGYYDSASDVMRYVDDFRKPNTLRDSVRFYCDETVKISFWDTRDEKEQKRRYLDALAQFQAWAAQSHRVSGTLYKGAKITFVTEQAEQRTLYKPRIENYSALLAQYSAAADDLLRRNTAMTALIAQDINASSWRRTTSAEIEEDKIYRDNAPFVGEVFCFSKHGYQPLTKDMRAPIALFVYKTWGADEIFLKDCDAPVVKKIPKAPDLKAW